MGNWIVGGIVILLVIGAVRQIYRNKKNGKTCGSCSGDCGSCMSRK